MIYTHVYIIYYKQIGYICYNANCIVYFNKIWQIIILLY